MPLDIIIAGAGLVGLSAAIALGRQGHKVDVYEKSSFKHEVGAAIHVGPMAQRCLASWGVDLKRIGPVEAVTLDRISITDDHSRDTHLVSFTVVAPVADGVRPCPRDAMSSAYKRSN